jgi:hypothetical protein
MRVANNGTVTFEDEQIEKDAGFAKVAPGQRLVADNCTTTGSMKIAEGMPTGAAMNPSPPTAEKMYENGCTNFRGCTRMYEFLVVFFGGGGSDFFGFCVTRRRG